MCKISVIVPVYNIENYIERCVDSLVRQTYTDLEIILVDDGSRDSGGRICDELAARDERIRVVHKENGGLASARNAGLDAASGDYISFVDGDDLLDPDTYEKLAEAIQKHRPDVVCFGYRKVCAGVVTDRCVIDYPEGLCDEESLRQLKLDAIFNPNVLDYNRKRILSSCTNLYRRDFLQEHQLRFRSEREVLNEDFLFVLQMMQAARSVYVSPRDFYYYDTREGSISTSYRQDMYRRKKALFEAYCQSLDLSDPEVAIRLDNFYIECIYSCMVNECSAGRERRQALAQIRVLLKDEQLQQMLRRRKDRVKSVKTWVICLLMRSRMAWLCYAGYRLVRYLKK